LNPSNQLLHPYPDIEYGMMGEREHQLRVAYGEKARFPQHGINSPDGNFFIMSLILGNAAPRFIAMLSTIKK